MTDHQCIAPIGDDDHLCGAPATCERIVEGLLCHLCPACAAELDRDTTSEDTMTTTELLTLAIDTIRAERRGDLYAYYDDAACATYVSTRDELVRLGEMLASGMDAAYSHWCAETTAVLAD
jgi:hypothetical protein